MVDTADVDGDGQADALVGDWDSAAGGANTGRAYVVLGPVASDASLGDAHATIDGEAYQARVGYCLRRAGDTDGDGSDDLMVYAMNRDGGSSYAGFVHIFSPAPSGGVTVEDADAVFSGPSAYYYLGGFGMSAAGDQDGDGYGDIALGAYADSDGGTEAGAAFVALGPFSGEEDIAAAWAKRTGTAGESAGAYLAGGEDLDADGHDDLVVSGYDSGGGTGSVYVLYGPVVAGTDALSNADAIFAGENVGDYAGYDLVVGPSATGGAADLLVGAAGYGSVGAAYLFGGG